MASTPIQSESNLEPSNAKPANLPWSPWLAIIVALFIYIFTQIVAIQIVAIYPDIKHWTPKATQAWLENDIIAQFFYVMLAEVMSVALVWGFLRIYRYSMRVIGLVKPKVVDIAYALTGLAVYFPVYVGLAALISFLIPSFNINQSQQIGFNNPIGTDQLVLVFFSLVILPPVAEEIIFRGLIFTTLRSRMRFFKAAIIVSVLFALPHLLEGGNTGLLWIAGLDTFILSIVLCVLREKTGRLYAGMGLHALKNFIAFVTLYLIH